MIRLKSKYYVYDSKGLQIVKIKYGEMCWFSHKNVQGNETHLDFS